MVQSVAIVGAGIAGMCTALALAKQGAKVTIFERDIPPPAAMPMKLFSHGNAAARHNSDTRTPFLDSCVHF